MGYKINKVKDLGGNWTDVGSVTLKTDQSDFFIPSEATPPVAAASFSLSH